MATTLKPFTAKWVNSPKPTGKSFKDPAKKGFWLKVRDNGKQYFSFRYDFDGKHHELGIGPVLDVSLSEAHAQADTWRVMLNKGINPKGLKAPPKASKSHGTVKNDTKTYFEWRKGVPGRERAWSEEHTKIWWASMENHVFPWCGDLPTAELTKEIIAENLKPLWINHNETGVRVLGRIRQVIGHAIDLNEGQFPRGNPAERVTKLLPTGVREKEVQHPAPTWEQVPEFYTLMKEQSELSAKAIRFLMATGCRRTEEVIGAEWSEIHGDEWHIPGKRMKSGNDTVVPLSNVARKILASLESKREGYIFPGSRTGKVIDGKFIKFRGTMQHNAMQELLREKLSLKWHVHGLRASFLSWSQVHAQTPAEVSAADLLIDHKIGSAVFRAYGREQLRQAQRALVSRWCEHLTG